MKRYIDYIKKYKFQLMLVCFFIFLNLIIDVIFPYINGKFIDNLIVSKSFFRILKSAILIFFIGFLNSIVKYNITYKSRRITELIIFDLKKFVLNHLRRISLITFKSYNSSYLNKRLDQDCSQMVSFFIDNYVIFFAKIIQIIIVFFILFEINIEITIIILLTSPLYYLIYKYFKKPIFTESLILREETAEFFHTFNNQFEYMEDIVIESNYDIQDNIVRNKFSNYFNSIMTYTKTIAKFSLAQGIFAILFQIIVFLVGGYYVIHEKMTVGELTMITTYFTIILSIISYYADFGKQFQIARSASSRMDELLNIKKEREGDLEISEISKLDALLTYAYKGNKNICEGVNFSAAKGEVIGIVGVNGSGKTTISKLLIGSLKHDTNEKFRVTYNDQYNLNNINTISLRNKNIAYIPQKIRYINVTICDIFNEIDKFSNSTQLVEFFINEGINIPSDLKLFLESSWNKKLNDLSGGDKQLIIILKNILKDADMMVLDEPSSNLDKERILWLKDMINTIKFNKIIFIISHDESLFDIFDRTINLK